MHYLWELLAPISYYIKARIMDWQNMTEAERKQIVYFQYTNWKGETAWRRAVPIPIPMIFGADNWHPEPEWKLVMFDLDKMDRRSFTLKDMKIGTEQDYVLGQPRHKQQPAEQTRQRTKCPADVGQEDYLNIPCGIAGCPVHDKEYY